MVLEEITIKIYKSRENHCSYLFCVVLAVADIVWAISYKTVTRRLIFFLTEEFVK